MEESESKKVLLITYYWPPSGGSGVQRWLKLTRYLPEFGWTPVVFTPENPAFELKDRSLEKEVHPDIEVLKFPIWEPYSLAGLKAGTAPPAAKSGSGSVFSGFMRWVRGNFILPDPRIFWVRPASDFLIDYLKTSDIRLIITTGPPHSIHLIGRRIHRKLPHIKWIADFRDPWSQWGLLDTLHTGSLARWVHKKLELSVLKEANHIITITPFYQRQFEQLSSRRVQLFPNGFDAADFQDFNPQKPEKFMLRHVGVVNERCNPLPFLASVAEWAVTRKVAIEVNFTGKVHEPFRQQVLATPGLKEITTFTAPVPHADLIRLYESSSILFIVLTGYKDGAGFLPGKLFEYLATGLPITGTGPLESDTADLLRQTGGGELFLENDPGLLNWLDFHYARYQQGELTIPVNDIVLQRYTRKAVAGRLADFLNKLR